MKKIMQSFVIVLLPVFLFAWGSAAAGEPPGYFVDKSDKRRLLVDLLRADQQSKTLVFSRTKHGANRIVRVLDKAGIDAVAIHVVTRSL